jgi:hypothetical protein
MRDVMCGIKIAHYAAQRMTVVDTVMKAWFHECREFLRRLASYIDLLFKKDLAP